MSNPTPIDGAASPRTPYVLAATSLVIMTVVVALGAIAYGFHDYDPNGTMCRAAMREVLTEKRHQNALPSPCEFPWRSIILAGIILSGGLGYAGRVWSRR